MKSTEKDNRLLVIIGLNENDKPQASWFAAAHLDLVRRAAGLMQLRVGAAATEEMITIVKELPKGRIYISGRAFVPIIKKPVYDKLIAGLQFDSGTPGSEAATPAFADDFADTEGPGAPWLALAAGGVVLAYHENDETAGWYEAVIVEVRMASLRLKWRDYAGWDEFSQETNQVALLHPLRKEP